jgi:hypothetical protein
MRQLLTNATYLENSGVTIAGIKVWGSPVTAAPPPPFHVMGFNVTPKSDEMKAVWAKIPRDTDVLVTHGPPYGVGDMNFVGMRAGSSALAVAVERVAPLFHVYGHIHEGYGVRSQGETISCNVASMNVLRKIQPRSPVVFDILVEREQRYGSGAAEGARAGPGEAASLERRSLRGKSPAAAAVRAGLRHRHRSRSRSGSSRRNPHESLSPRNAPRPKSPAAAAGEAIWPLRNQPPPLSKPTPIASPRRVEAGFALSSSVPLVSEAKCSRGAIGAASGTEGPLHAYESVSAVEGGAAVAAAAVVPPVAWVSGVPQVQRTAQARGAAEGAANSETTKSGVDNGGAVNEEEGIEEGGEGVGEFLPQEGGDVEDRAEESRSVTPGDWVVVEGGGQ